MSRSRRLAGTCALALLPAAAGCGSPLPGGEGVRGGGGGEDTAVALRVDDGPAAAFFRFWEAAGEREPSARTAPFRETVVPSFPDYYAWKFHRWEEEGREPEDALAAELEATAPLVPRMRRDAAALVPALRASLPPFLRMFPDFRGPLEVHLLHSLGEVDGGMRTLSGGRSPFLLGLDLIARHHPEGDLAPFLHHELFHAYHAQRFNPDGDPDRPGRSVLVALWMEGLAACAAARLHPGAGPRELLLDVPPGSWGACLDRERELTEALLADLRATDRATYAGWFLLGHGGGRPDRAGYVLGYRIVGRAAEGRDLREMATMKGWEIEDLVREAAARVP